jgi:hypothetical protein
MKPPDLSTVVPSIRIKGEDQEETAELKRMFEEAKRYLLSFHWCGGIDESYMGIGVGGVIGVFLFKIRPTQDDIDEWLWVIVGDVPPAYITALYASDPDEALKGYLNEMTKWAEAAKRNSSVDDLIPVNVPPTPENAKLLESRLELLKEELLSDSE